MTNKDKISTDRKSELKDKKKLTLTETGARRFANLSQAAFERNYPDLSFESLKETEKFPEKLEKVHLLKKEMANTGLDSLVQSFICGTVFGDSNLAIQKGYSNARLSYRHSTRQTEWFMWKTLGPLRMFVKPKAIQFQKPDGKQRKDGGLPGETYGKWKVATAVDPKLTALHNIICPGGKKRIERSWLNHMGNYFLMGLWLDDGGLINARQGIISCNSTPFDQAEVLAEYITVVWGAKCKVQRTDAKATITNPEPTQISFVDLDNLETFLRIIAPIIPVKSMIYKVCIYPDHSNGVRLQRWTTELKSLVRKEFHSEIDLYYAYLSAIKEQQGD